MIGKLLIIQYMKKARYKILGKAWYDCFPKREKGKKKKSAQYKDWKQIY